MNAKKIYKSALITLIYCTFCLFTAKACGNNLSNEQKDFLLEAISKYAVKTAPFQEENSPARILHDRIRTLSTTTSNQQSHAYIAILWTLKNANSFEEVIDTYVLATFFSIFPELEYKIILISMEKGIATHRLFVFYIRTMVDQGKFEEIKDVLDRACKTGNNNSKTIHNIDVCCNKKQKI